MIKSYDKVLLARSEHRPRAKEIIDNIFEDIFYQRGDRCFADSKTVLGGIATFDDRPITFIGIQKGKGIEESVKTNFGMPMPEGYRKAIRIMKQAEKFNRPLITFVDTPGAYPGIEAEERGQFQAISDCIATLGAIKVPVISFIIGEGGSGGALALAVANKVYMFENSVYSVLSPEGFASIVYKDASKADEVSEIMKLTSTDLKGFGIVEDIISEDKNQIPYYGLISQIIKDDLRELDLLTGEQIVDMRQERFIQIGR